MKITHKEIIISLVILYVLYKILSITLNKEPVIPEPKTYIDTIYTNDKSIFQNKFNVVKATKETDSGTVIIYFIKIENIGDTIINLNQ